MKRYPPIVPKMPHMIHGADYNPDQWISMKDTIWQEDMRIGRLAHMNSLSVGIFAWAMLEPQEDQFTFEWMDEVMDNLANNGMTAVLATPSGARPAWMSQKYPEVLRVRQDRHRNLHGSRHNHCLTSPIYRQKVEKINTLLAERYKDHPALGIWHISNEYSGECHCDLCQQKFRDYVKEKYKTLDAVNEAWWTTFWSHRYTDWSQIESPSDIGERNTHGLTLEWQRFTTEQFVDFYLHETAPLKRITPNIPCTTNLMAGYGGIDYARLAQVMDVVSWDSYPRWTGTDKDIAVGKETAFYHALMYGLKRKPFLLMESCPSATNWREVAKLHRPGMHMLQSMQAIAHGSDSVQYFQMRKGRGSSEKFHGAVIDHEGSENTRVFRDIASVGEALTAMDSIVGTTVPAQVAIVHDYLNRWALDDVKGLLQKKTGYVPTVMDHFGALWEMNVPADVIDQTMDFSSYKVLIAPMLYLVRDGFAQRVEEFVKNGGTFVATYVTGQVNETDLCFLGGFPGPLKDVLGIWAEEVDALFPGDTNAIIWDGGEYAAFDLCELIHPQGAVPIGLYKDDFYAGQAALTRNEYGKGTAYYIAARTGLEFLKDFYSSILDESDVWPLLDMPAPQGVSVQARTDGENTYLFFMNFSREDKIVDAGEHGLLSLAPYEVRVLTEDSV